MQRKQVDIFLIKVLYIAIYAIIITQVLALYSLGSLFFSATFIIVFVLWLLTICREFDWRDGIVALTVVLSFLCITINAARSNTAITLSYLKKYIMFITTFVFFSASSKVKITKDLEKLIFGINTFVCLFLIGFYFLNKDLAYLYNGQRTIYLTFRFTNPNLTAMFLMCVCLIEFMKFYTENSTIKRIIYLVLSVVMVYFLFETKARNCLLALVLTVALFVVYQLKKHDKGIKSWFVFVIVISPLLFALIYMSVIDESWFHRMFNFVVNEGKELDARLYIWTYAFEYFRSSPLIGAYSEISRGTGQSQMHNTHIDTLCSYGVFVFALFCYVLYLIVARKGNCNKYRTLLTICFMGTLFVGFGEAALFSGGMGIYILAGTFLLLRNADAEYESSLIHNTELD